MYMLGAVRSHAQDKDVKGTSRGYNGEGGYEDGLMLRAAMGNKKYVRTETVISLMVKLKQPAGRMTRFLGIYLKWGEGERRDGWDKNISRCAQYHSPSHT